MTAPAAHRFSVKEYYRMAETGILHHDARVELLDGQIIDKSPISPLHGAVTMILNEFLCIDRQARWIISVRTPVRLDEYSEPEPDIMLIKPLADFYKHRHPQPDDVFLLVEISDYSLERDRAEKLPLYARAGIAEVWIVDLNEQTIEVYRQPSISGYGSRVILNAGEKASPQAFPDVKLDVGELLKR
jgi:Uma2 family endonuclease